MNRRFRAVLRAAFRPVFDAMAFDTELTGLRDDVETIKTKVADLEKHTGLEGALRRAAAGGRVDE